MKSLGIWSWRIVRRRRQKWYLMVRLVTITLTIILLHVVILALGPFLLDCFTKNGLVPIALSAIEPTAVEFIATEHIILG